MTYLSADQIATKFSANRVIAGESINIFLTHKQSNWLMRQAEYNKQFKNQKAWGSILGGNGQVVGEWLCSKESMRNSVFILTIKMYRNEQQKADENNMIQKQIDGLKLAIESAKQSSNNDFIINEIQEQIDRLESQLAI